MRPVLSFPFKGSVTAVIGRCHAASEQPADESRFREKLRVAPSGGLMDASFLLLKFMGSLARWAVAVGEARPESAIDCVSSPRAAIPEKFRVIITMIGFGMS